MNTNDIERLGYDSLQKEAAEEQLGDGFSVVRVIEVNKNNYVVSDGSHEMPGELSGKFMFNAENPTDYPTVGDWVSAKILDNNTLALLHSVLPRKTLLKRKEAGKRIDYQLIAANIDVGFVVQSADHVNQNLLDRYLVMLYESGIRPVAVFSKIDLLSPSEIETLHQTLSTLTTEYLLISNTTEKGTEQLSSMLMPGKTYCLLGQSGVGKTSLLNSLLHSNVLKVGEVREVDGRGRHTTVKRQLVHLDSGSMFIDTPGMRELGNFEIQHGLDQAFEDFASYAKNCRFRDCTHMHEDGCAILEAVDRGEIEESRYRNYVKITKESEFYEMSYKEKRKKDKSFGRMVKNFKKRKGMI